MANATPDSIVTPEAVVLQFETGGFGSRSIAWIIDAIIQAVFVTLVAIAFGIFSINPDTFSTAGRVIAILLLSAFPFAYHACFETWWKGRTPGKAALGLRVITEEGAPPRFRHAAIRSSLGLIDFYLTVGFAAVVSVLVSKSNQRLGDLVAGTLVLRQRTAVKMPAARKFEIPPGLESYAATLDTAAMTTADYSTVRSFLIRSPKLSSESNKRVGGEIAGAIAGRLNTKPPDGMEPTKFLQCVAAVFQNRGKTDASAAPLTNEQAIADIAPQGPEPEARRETPSSAGGFSAPN